MEDSAANENRQSKDLAPGTPGAEAHWAPGQKSGVGTALSNESNVWFSIGQGILNEIYYPQVDTPSTKEMGFVITNGHSYYSEEKIATSSDISWLEEGIPAFKLINSSFDGNYQLEKEIISDPKRSTILQRTIFRPTDTTKDLRLFVFLAPHLGDMGADNTAWIEETSSGEMLLAERDGCVLALGCSINFSDGTVGYEGTSDGKMDLAQNKLLSKHYIRADKGNVTLTAEIPWNKAQDGFCLAIGFGRTAKEAIANTQSSLIEPFEQIKQSYMNGWKQWQSKLPTMLKGSLVSVSQTVLKTHQSKNPGGGIVAGLASPWGYAQGDSDKIGYHAVWTRDMVESAGGLLAAGDHSQIREMLIYLENTQRPDGHWPQNMWIDGTPFWNGVQMDETALPILLVNLACKEKAISSVDVNRFWPMVKKAASYILQNGPVTQQDRWEEDPGYTPFTIGAEIAALLVAADFADQQKQSSLAYYMRSTADIWEESIDDWMYSSDSEWCEKYQVSGYYERIAPLTSELIDRNQNMIHIANVQLDKSELGKAHLVSPDALALVRFGLRSPDDPRIINTIKVIDSLLKIETPYGPTWHRYNDDGYGEHQDGSAFDGTGIGRGWPLLTGERAHYELAVGNKSMANSLQLAMESFANRSGLLPEQVWDSLSIAKYDLKLGRPSGSATPLAWAHAEYLKLCRSILEGKIFDLPSQTVQRYLFDKTTFNFKSWRFNHKIHSIPSGKNLRIETLAPATIHWSNDNWQTTKDTPTANSNLGVYYIDLCSKDLAPKSEVTFTFYWHHADHWEGNNFIVNVL